MVSGSNWQDELTRLLKLSGSLHSSPDECIKLISEVLDDTEEVRGVLVAQGESGYQGGRTQVVVLTTMSIYEFLIGPESRRWDCVPIRSLTYVEYSEHSSFVANSSKTVTLSLRFDVGDSIELPIQGKGEIAEAIRQQAIYLKGLLLKG